MRINGWHRLWLVGAFVWFCVIAVYGYIAAAAAPSGSEGDVVRTAALIWVLTSVAALIVGHGVAWALKGFSLWK